MRNYVSAVKYGLETLGVLSDQLFQLIESSKGYTGEDYDRWLAARIIDVAEKDGVGFSQLLVKKFAILSELSSMDGGLIRGEYLDFFCRCLEYDRGSIYTLGMREYGEYFEKSKMIDDLDISAGVDLDEENSFFCDTLPNDLQEKVRDGEMPFLLKFDFDTVGKKSELMSDAKTRCVDIRYAGALALYRMCLLYDVFGRRGKSRFGFLCPAEFLYDIGNADIIRELTGRFMVRGYSISDLNPYYGEYAFCICEALDDGMTCDGVYLQKVKVAGQSGIKARKGKFLYSHSGVREINRLRSMPREEISGIVETADGGARKGTCLRDVVGYVVSSGREVYVSSIPVDGCELLSGVYSWNLYECVVYYGVVSAMAECGIGKDLRVPLSGHKLYFDLVYNCLPLFLFDLNSKFRGWRYSDGSMSVVEENNFSLDSDIVGKLLEKAEPHFIFEAKELMDVCRKFYKRCDKDTTYLTFEDVRNAVADDYLNKMYYNDLVNLKKTICSTYREVF